MSPVPNFAYDPLSGLNPVERLQGATGSIIRIFHPCPGHLVTQVVGRLEAEMSRLIPKVCDPLLAARPLELWHDWSAMPDFDAECRTTLTKWAFDNRKRITRMNFSFKSRIVAVGVSTAAVGLSLAGLRIDTAPDHASWQRELSSVIGPVLAQR